MSSSIKTIKEDLIINYVGHVFGKGYCTHCLKMHAPYSFSCSCNKKNHIENCIYKAVEQTFNEKFVTKLFMFSQSKIGKTRKRCETLALMASSGAWKIAKMKKLDRNSLNWNVDDAVEVMRSGADSVSHLLLWNNRKILDRKMKDY